MLKLRFILPLLLILLATFACYHRLLLRTPAGEFRYTAIRWGLKDFMYPRLIFNSDSIRSGIFPLWNPYPFGGYPWVSNFQACLFHPLNLLIIFTVGYTAELLQIQLVFIFVIAGLAMYFCAREFSATRPASLLAAISFIGCGFFVGHAPYFPQINTLAVFPLCVLFTHKVVREMKLRVLCGGSLFIAIMIFSGFPTMAIFMGLFSFFFGLLMIFFIEKKHRATQGKKLIYLTGLFVLAFFLAAVLLFPAIESYGFLTRPLRFTQDQWEDIVLKKSLSGYNLLSLPFPFLGLQSLSAHGLWQEFRNCGIGLVGLFFAVYYFVFSPGRFKWTIFFLWLISLIFSLGRTTPFYRILYHVSLPFRMVSHPAMDFRAIFLFLLCLAAGLGMDDLLKSWPKGRLKITFSLLLLLFIAFPFIVIAAQKFQFNIGEGFAKHYLWFITIILFILLILLAQVPRRYIFLFVIALTLIDTAYWVNRNFYTVAIPARKGKWAKTKAKEQARSKEVIASQNFQRKREHYSRKAAWSMFWKYFSDSGHDGTRLKSFETLMNTRARSILSENFRVMPIYSVRIFNSKKDVLDEINKGADLHRVGLVAQEDIKTPGLESRLGALSIPGEGQGNFRARITSYNPNQIEYDVFLKKAALIFFNEIYYPGWILKEGKEEIPLFPVNYAFRGAFLEAGQYRLEMVFAPRSYTCGLIATTVSGLFCLGVFVGYALKSTITKRRYSISR